MTYIFCILAAVAPSLWLLNYFVKSDRFPEPEETLRMVFMQGVRVVGWVVLFAMPVMVGLEALDGVIHPYVKNFGLAFLCAAIPEEFFKYRVLRKYVGPHKDFDEPMDGVVYGATASLGFATLENILYCFEGGLSTAILRAFTAVPAHAAFGALMGHNFAQRHFGGKSNSAWGPALWLPVFLHGVYDWMAFLVAEIGSKEETEISDQESLIVVGCVLVFFATCGWMFIRVRSIVRTLRQQQALLIQLDNSVE